MIPEDLSCALLPIDNDGTNLRDRRDRFADMANTVLACHPLDAEDRWRGGGVDGGGSVRHLVPEPLTDLHERRVFFIAIAQLILQVQ